VTPHAGRNSYRFPKSRAIHLLTEDVVYDPPAYVWVLTLGGPTAIAAATCIALYGGAVRTGLGRRRAALLAGTPARRPPKPITRRNRREDSHAIHRNRR